ncbi:MAG: putative nucleic acid-binding protein [Akkermansiaceae bacterium]|jgi:predicted nucleic acid-binding protein
MIALVDTNVVLDVLLKREPYFPASASVMADIERGLCQGALCATTVTTIHYLAERTLGAVKSRRKIADLLTIFDIAAVNRAVLEKSLVSKFDHYEDAVLHEAALIAGLDCIITRNTKDFGKAQIPVFTPSQFLEQL